MIAVLASATLNLVSLKYFCLSSPRFHPLAVLGCRRRRGRRVAGDGQTNVPLQDERLSKLAATDALRGSKGDREREREGEREEGERRGAD